MIHVVSHTHWDREWYLTFQQFRLKLVHLMDGLLDLLAADPNYRYFTLDGQTIVLEDYLQMRPQREEEIRRHVQSGRLPIGPWYILPDEFLVSPESIVRNLLVGRQVARRFGPPMAVGYIPDPFGHLGQIPQILRGFGIETAAVGRGLGDEPCELWWESPDGSRVLLANMRDSYDNAAYLPIANPAAGEMLVSVIRMLSGELAAHSATDQVLLMHGTDHMEPQPRTPEALAFVSAQLGDPVLHSTLPLYLDALAGEIENQHIDIPTVTGELRSPQRRHLLPGVLSTRMWIKQCNQACETLLEQWAEPFSAWATAAVGPAGEAPTGTLDVFRLSVLEGLLHNPTQIVREAWRLLLTCHPHDSICGCSIDQVHEEMRPRFAQVEQVGQEITRQSLIALSAAADTRPPETVGESIGAIVVFNPVAGPRTDAVTARVELPPRYGEFELVDERGMALPYRVVEQEQREVDRRLLSKEEMVGLLVRVSNGRFGDRVILEVSLQREGDHLCVDAALADSGVPDLAMITSLMHQVQQAIADPTLQAFEVRAHINAATVEFVAPQVTGHGYSTFWLRSGVRRPAPQAVPSLSVENQFLTLTASPEDGTLTLLDRRTGARYSSLNRFVDGGDRGDEYNYCPPEQDTLVAALKPTQVSILVDEPRREITVRYTLPIPARLSADRLSRSRQTAPLEIHTVASLLPGVDRVDITTEVDNQADDHRLRVHFPAPFVVQEADYDMHFEVVRRRLGVVHFDQSWVEEPRPEVPQRAFTDISDGKIGLMVANRGLPEVEVVGTGESTEIALTLLRCVGWLSRGDFPCRKGNAGPMVPTPLAQMPGRHRFEYSIIPHAGGWEKAYSSAYAFGAPLRSAPTSVHPGPLGPHSALVQVEPAAFVLSAVKEAEDGKGLVIRGYNVSAEPIHVTLKPWRRFARAARARMDEVEVGELGVAQDGVIEVEARGHEVVTVRVEG